MEHLLKQLLSNPQVALDLLAACKAAEKHFPGHDSPLGRQLRSVIAEAEANHIRTRPLPEALAHEAAAVGILFDHESLEQGEPS